MSEKDVYKRQEAALVKMETLIMDFTAISGKMEDLEIGNLIKQKEMIFMQIYR